MSNSSYKMVSDDPTASLVSPNQFGGRPGKLTFLFILNSGGLFVNNI